MVNNRDHYCDETTVPKVFVRLLLMTTWRTADTIYRLLIINAYYERKTGPVKKNPIYGRYPHFVLVWLLILVFSFIFSSFLKIFLLLCVCAVLRVCVCVPVAKLANWILNATTTAKTSNGQTLGYPRQYPECWWHREHGQWASQRAQSVSQPVNQSFIE